MDDVDDFLEHFGVKGMHWGQRKAKAPMTVAQLKEHRAKLVSINDRKYDGHKLFRAYNNRAKSVILGRRDRQTGNRKLIYAAKTQGRRDAFGTTRYLAEGAAVSAAILGGSHVLLKHTKMDPKTRRGMQATAAIAAAMAGVIPAAQNAHSLHYVTKHEKLLDEIQNTDRQIKALQQKQTSKR